MTAKKCPLSERNAMYWQNESGEGGFPEICQETCEKLWEVAMRTQRPELDHFEENCVSANTEHGDISLQGTQDLGSTRYLGILTICATHDEEAFSETYTFDCPNS